MEKNKVAFIGPKFLYDPLTEFDSSWDLQVPVENIEDFGNMIESGEISDETKLIIIFSRYFAGDEEEFARTIAYYCPYAVVIVLIPEEDIEKGDDSKIKAKVKAVQKEYIEDGYDYNENSPFYFARYTQAGQDIEDAIRQYVEDPNVDRDVATDVSTLIADSTEDEFELEEDDDTIKIPQAHGSGQVITVTSSKGGAGKSTVAVALASFIKRASESAYNEGKIERPYTVITIDLDVRDGQLGFLNGAFKAPNIIDVISAGDLSKETIKGGIYHNPKTGVDFLFASKRPRNASEIPPDVYSSIIQYLREMYDYIILDTSVNYLDPLLNQVAYPICDKLIYVTDMGISSIFGMSRWIVENVSSETTRKAVEPEKVGIVINKAIKNVNMEPDKIQKAAKGLPILGVLPNAPQLTTYSANTADLQRILNHPLMNDSFRIFAQAVVDDENALGEVSFD